MQVFLAILLLSLLGVVTDASAASPLRTQGTRIVNAEGKTVQLKGFNLGGWFVMEGFMSPMDASSPQAPDTYTVMKTLENRFGVATQRRLMRAYQETWITGDDIANIANAGFNVVRVPIWWGQFFDLSNPTISGFRDDGFAVLDQLVQQCAARGVYVILDLHGAIGGQSMNLHTGQQNSNRFWTDENAQSMTAWLWWQVANHYKGNATIAGFDLLNEPDVRRDGRDWTDADRKKVWDANDRLYKAVRSADPNRMVIIEGTFAWWSWSQLPPPSQYGWTNVVYEMHEYQWSDTGSTNTDTATLRAGIDKQVQDFKSHASWNVPGYIGEFNVFNGGATTWRYAIDSFNAAGLSWSMWSYKAVNGVAPNFWGWYDPARWVQRPILATDSAEEIERKWRLWSTTSIFARNEALGIRP